MKFHYQIMLFITGVLFGVNAGNAADDSLEGNFFPDKAGAWEYKLLGYDVLQYHGKDLRCKLGPDKPFCDKVQLIYDITRANPVFNPPLGFQARAITNWISTAPLSAADNGKEALPVLEYGVSIRPKNALLRLNLANSYMDAGSDAKAKAILDTLAFEYPNDRPATGGKHYEGKKYAISYSRKDNAAPISMLQIVRNYEAAIAKIGGKHLGGDGRRIAAEIQKGGSVTGVYVEAYSPIASNKEEDGRAQNRRVEMVEQ